MKLNEKMSYLKGLMDGLELDTTTKEGKILVCMRDLMEEMVGAVNELDDDLDQAFDEIDAISEDLEDLEDFLADEDDEDDDEEEEEEEDDDEESDEYTYAIPCPNCGTANVVTEEEIMNDSVICPECGTQIKVEFVESEEGEEAEEAEEPEEEE